MVNWKDLQDQYGDKFGSYGKLAIIAAGFYFFFSSKTVRRGLVLILLVAVVAGAMYFVKRPDPVSSDFLQQVGLKVREGRSGLSVAEVNLAAPPVTGEIRADDYIMKVNGNDVASVADIVQFAQSQRSSTVDLRVRRGSPTGAWKSVKLELPGEETSVATVGLSGKYLDWVPGLVVTRVVPGGPADVAGLALGDLVKAVEIQGSFEPVVRADDLQAALATQSPTTVQIESIDPSTGIPSLPASRSLSLTGPVTLQNVNVQNSFRLFVFVYQDSFQRGASIVAVPPGGNQQVTVPTGSSLVFRHEVIPSDPRYDDAASRRNEKIIVITPSTNSVTFP